MLPPSPLPPPPSAPERLGTPAALNHFHGSKNLRNQQHPAAKTPDPVLKKFGQQTTLSYRQPQRTNPVIWCCAVLCFIFSLLLIFFGIATLIIFLVVKPRYPVFDAPIASLNSVYFDSLESFNGDFTFLANFSNPNKKINLRFEYVDLEVYFSENLIATQSSQPFSLRHGETGFEAVHMISSLVHLPQRLAGQLQTQVQSNRIKYNIRGSFKLKASMGLLHFSYWLHSKCEIEMTGPPNGVLVARSCKTKR